MDSLVLSPADVNTAMGQTGMTQPDPAQTVLTPGSSANMAETNCQSVIDDGLVSTYAGTGFSAVRYQFFTNGEVGKVQIP
jgi:PknH-like extracellular domain